MLFKDIKSGYPVYFLNREIITAYQGKVVSVSVPRYDMQVVNKANAPLVVDITIDANGQTKTYTISENATTTYAGNIVLSTERDGIVREVEAMKSQKEDAIAQEAKNHEDLDKINSLLEDWNPALAEKRKQDERINTIEQEVRSIGQQLKDFFSEFKSKTP